MTGAASIQLKRWLVSSRQLRTVLRVSLLAVVVILIRPVEVFKASGSAERSVAKATLSGQIGIHAADHVNSTINLGDSRDVLTSYRGPSNLRRALDQNEARALSVASADFDEDGVPDLICGYAGPDCGIITLHRGNLDSGFPNSPQALRRKVEGAFTNSPFFASAAAFELPAPADFLGAGDFDGDNHCDVVTAARGDNEFHFLRGDGKGGLASVIQIGLPGSVTAMIAGEINRRDGLGDLVVAIVAPDGPEVLVFEGPGGALKAKPESFHLPAEATSLALGQLDDEYQTGRDLIVVHGRDRRLSLDAQKQSEVPGATLTTRSFQFELLSIAVGDFAGNSRTDIALLAGDGKVHLLQKVEPRSLQKDWVSEAVIAGYSDSSLIPARLSGRPADSLLIVDRDGGQLQILVVNNTHNTSEERLSNTLRSQRKLRVSRTVSLDTQAKPIAVLPMRLNADALSDFVILRSGQTMPTVLVTEPAATFVVTNTEDDGQGSLRDAITQANNNPGADTISFNIPGSGPHTIKPRSALPEIGDPLTLDGTTQPGFAGAPVIELNGARLGPEQSGLFITGGNSTVRGLVINRAKDNIRIEDGGGNVVEGNFLGTDSAGLASPGPQSVGVYVSHSRGNVIGGTTQQARNIISGNAGGVSLADSNENIVSGNFIGVDRTGSAALGNGVNGVDIGGSNNTIGGTIAGARNVISGNGADGINLFEGRGNLIQGNLIGTDSSGNSALGNRGSGVLLLESSDTIGGTVISARNIISGNGVQGTGSEGVAIIGRDTTRTTGNKVQGNFVGTDVTGARALSNFGNGVATTDVVDTIIGGATDEARNVISGNTGEGVAIGVLLSGRSGGTKIIVQGNFIGTDATGTVALGNENGIFVDADSVTNTIQNNRIAFNRSNGVFIPDNNNPGVRIAIVSNSIYSNSLLGIDLGSPGVTPNDDKDVDIGANELQNFPVLTSATASPTNTLASTVTIAAVRASIGGTFNSTPNAQFTLEFFFGTQCSSSEPQAVGMIPVPLKPTLQLTTDNNGSATFLYDFDFPSGVTLGVVICTATDSRGNTSEQSPCFAVALPSCPPTISPTTRLFVASGGSDAVNVFASAGCAWAARSGADWISITSGTGGTTSGVVSYSVAANSGKNVRSGTMTIAEQTVTVTQQGLTPVIDNAAREGKKLIVIGERFDDGARILINGERQKTANDPDSPTTRLIGKKAGKLVVPGDRLQVQNSDGGLSPEFIYRGSSANTSASRRR